MGCHITLHTYSLIAKWRTRKILRTSNAFVRVLVLAYFLSSGQVRLPLKCQLSRQNKLCLALFRYTDTDCSKIFLSDKANGKVYLKDGAWPERPPAQAQEAFRQSDSLPRSPTPSAYATQPLCVSTLHTHPTKLLPPKRAYC